MWITPHTVALDVPGHFRVLQFSQRRGIPHLIVPPKAGHGGWIVDMHPDSSLIQTALANADGPVFVLDYPSCTPERRFDTIAVLMENLDAAVNHLGGWVNLYGLCQGGWESLIYACLHPEKVSDLTLAGAPLDAHAGESILADSLKIDLSVYEAVVAAQGGVMKGDMMLAAWVGFDWPKHFAKLPLIWSHRLFGGWTNAGRFDEWYYKDTRDIPGAWYLECIEHIFLNNRLIKNEMYVNGQHVNLHNLRKLDRINLVAGGKDDITPKEQVFALEKYAACHTHLIGGAGHVGVFMGKRGHGSVWPQLFQGDS